MDAKRIVPMLQLQGGKVVAGPDFLPPLDPGRPADWACRLELEGADGVLFRETEDAQGDRAGWIKEVAGSLAIPFSLEAPFRSCAELEEALEAGADKVILTAPAASEDPILAAAVRNFGRCHVAVAVNAVLAEGSRWRVELADQPEGRDALAWMVELEQRGAGEILLRATPEGEACAALCQATARLALAVLFRSSGDAAQAAAALLHGADGLAFPAATGSSRQWKTALGAHGLPLRQ
jgi:cyclase